MQNTSEDVVEDVVYKIALLRERVEELESMNDDLWERLRTLEDYRDGIKPAMAAGSNALMDLVILKTQMKHLIPVHHNMGEKILTQDSELRRLEKMCKKLEAKIGDGCKCGGKETP